MLNIALTSLAALGGASVAFAAPSDTSYLFTRTTPSAKGVTLQMFQWNWDSLAQECKAWIGPNGYGYVEVSPPMEHYNANTWWSQYQPVSYQLVSDKGNRDQFANMVSACRSAGVDVIVDIIWNHMAGVDDGVGTAGTHFQHYNYPGVWGSGDFHYCPEPGHDIAKWNDATDLQTCELANLADLKTESTSVRNKLIAYTNDLLSLGVAGFRIDAAKHMPVADIKAIQKGLKSKFYGTLRYTQEVVYEGGAGPKSSDYTGLGEVQEFRYSTAIKAAFDSGKLTDLKDLNSKGWLPSASANTFVVNHDRERSKAALNYLDDWANKDRSQTRVNKYTLANIFTLGYGYGSPTILSSYEIDFGNTGLPGPNGRYGTCSGNGGANGWLCQHRWPAMVGMTGFSNKVRGTGVGNWKSSGSNKVAWTRGSAGFVAINSSGSDWTTSFTVSLPDGVYCDVVAGSLTNNNTVCNGTKVTVKGQKIASLKVPKYSAVAIHIGKKVKA